MKKRLIHHSREETAEETLHASHARQETGLAFDSVESLLRHDAAHMPVPPEVGERVRRSFAGEPPPSPASMPWWKRWLRR